MIQITTQPPPIILSGNPAFFSVMCIPSLDTPNLVMAEVFMGGESIGKDYAYASNQNIAYFDLSEYFDTFITPIYSEISDTNQIFYKVNSMDSPCREFSVVFSDLDNNSTAINIMAVKGKISQHERHQNIYPNSTQDFVEFLGQNGSVLTLRPDKITIKDPLQPERLFFLVTSSTPLPVTIKRVITLASGSKITSNIASISSAIPGDVFAIRCSYETIINLNYTVDPDNPPVNYTIELFNGATSISKEYKFEIDFSQSDKAYFVFLNPLGGFDTFCATGKQQLNFSCDVDYTPQSISPTHYHNFFSLTQRNSLEVFEINTGFLPFPYIQHLFQMLSSPDVYHFHPSEHPILTPVILSSNTASLKTNIDQLQAATFKYILNPRIHIDVQVPK